VPPERKLMRLRLPEPPRSGRVVIELENIYKSYGGNRVFADASLVVERGERLALVGPNGVGKSTLMRLLSGVEPPDSGAVKPGHNVERAHFSQDRYDLDPNRTVLENLAEGAPIDMVPKLRNILGAFLFQGDDVDKRVKVLSGGEKSRLALARLLLRPANVLLLDEPTNHLDLDSKEILLDALKAYQGTLVFVSHDRYFLDQLATKVAEVGNGGIELHWGGYPDFLRAKARALEPEPAPELPRFELEEEDEPVEAAPPNLPAGTLSKNKTRALQERVEELEKRIAETEIGIESLEARMSVPGFYDDPIASEPIVSTHEKLKRELVALEKEWEEVSEKVPG
ncbi:MAG TPA: ATP-binding cassette domain-containing protein, partial [Vicinamibacteria bacterium]|nr:ATP-binding cassette domain-containing protein [Vicinamibacteria bacterium]